MTPTHAPTGRTGSAIRSGARLRRRRAAARPARPACVAVAGGSQVTLTWDAGAGRDRLPGPRRRRRPTATWQPLDHAGRDVLAVPHPPYVDTTGHAGRGAVVRRRRRSPTCTSRARCPRRCRRPRRRAGRAGDGRGRRRPPTSASCRPAVAADDRQRAPLARAVDRHHRRPGGRRGAERGAARPRTTSSASRHVRAHGDPLRRPRGLPRGGRRAGPRLLGRGPGLRPHPLARALPGRRDLVHAARPGQRPVARRSSTTARSSRRPRTGTAGTTWSATSPPTWSSATATRSSSTGPSRCGTRPTSRSSGPGTPEEYLQLYDVTAAAVRDGRRAAASSADRRRPRPAGSRSCSRTPSASGAPVDFVSTHTYGCPPLDFRPMLERYGRAGTPIWWTEWGVTPTHFNEVSDAVFSGHVPGPRDALGDGPDRVAVLLGRLRPLRGARPAAGPAARRLRAAHRRRAAQAPLVGAGAAGAARRRAGSPCRYDGDGGGSLVEAVAATAADDGDVSVLLWNLTLDQTKAAGVRRARPRRCAVEVTGLDAGCDVHADARAGRRGPLQRRVGLGRAARGRPGLADRRAVGARCARPTGSRSSSRRATVTADDDGVVASRPSCRCRR